MPATTKPITDLHRDAVAAILRSARTGRGYDRHQTRELVYVASLPDTQPDITCRLMAEVDRRSDN